MSKSKPSLQRQTSTISEINVEPEERGDIDTELLTGSNTKGKKTHMGEKKPAESSALPEQRTEDGEPRQLKVESKEWAQVLKAAKEAMGNLEPSTYCYIQEGIRGIRA